MPTAPAAPVLFTTTTGFFRTFSRAAATGRAVRSATPPGGKGATMLTGRSGYFSCAETVTARTSKIIKGSKRKYRRHERIIHLRWVGLSKLFCLTCGVYSELLQPIKGFPEERQDAEQQEHESTKQHHRRDRPIDEDRVAPRGHGQRLAKAHLQHRREYEPQYYRRGLEVKLAKQIAERAHRSHDADVDGTAIDRVNTENAKEQDRGIEQRVRHSQYIDEDSHQGKVEDQQHHVTDVHAGNKTPEKLGLLRDQQRPRGDSMHHHGGDHHRGYRSGRKTESEHGNKGAGRGGVISRLRAGDAFDGAVSEALRVFGKTSLHGIGNEGRDDMSRAGNDADEEAEHRSSPDRPDRGAPFLGRGKEVFQFGLFDFRRSRLPRGQQNFRETEQSHGHRNDADTVTQFDQAIAKAKEARHRIDADHAQEKPQCRHRERLEHGTAAHIGE